MFLGASIGEKAHLTKEGEVAPTIFVSEEGSFVRE